MFNELSYASLRIRTTIVRCICAIHGVTSLISMTQIPRLAMMRLCIIPGIYIIEIHYIF